MQGLADGYFVIPYTLATYLAEQKPIKENKELTAEGKRTQESVENRISKLMESVVKDQLCLSIKSLETSCGKTVAWLEPKKGSSQL